MTLLRLAPAPDPATTLIEPEPGRARLTTAPRPTPEQLRLFVDLPTAVPDPPGPTGIRRRNPRLQGEIGLSDAIAFFGRRVRLPFVGLPHGVTGWRPPEVRPSPPPCG